MEKVKELVRCLENIKYNNVDYYEYLNISYEAREEAENQGLKQLSNDIEKIEHKIINYLVSFRTNRGIRILVNDNIDKIKLNEKQQKELNYMVENSLHKLYN